VKLGSKILGVVMSGAFAAAASLMGAGAAHAAATTDPNTCFIQTDNGRYVTAVGGGGRTTDVMHTNATVPSTWERFTLVYSGDGSHYGLRTAFGYYVTAVNSGGLSSANFPDVLHTDATVLQDWEKFSFVSDGTDGKYGLRAFDGHLLSAVGGGGRTSRAFDSNRTVLSTWEKFRFTCNV
jgi:hypothetical protein